MKYENGDKVVIKLTESDVCFLNDLSAESLIRGENIDMDTSQILGKLEDFIPAEKKIKMSVEEKKEFDRLKIKHSGLYGALDDISSEEYPNLFNLLFVPNDEKHRKAQLEFSRVWEKPSRIEVEKKKKYYVHLLETNSNGYLNYYKSTKEYCIGSKRELGDYKTKFIKSEIAKIHFANFKFNDKALEEVEGEND